MSEFPGREHLKVVSEPLAELPDSDPQVVALLGRIASVYVQLQGRPGAVALPRQPDYDTDPRDISITNPVQQTLSTGVGVMLATVTSRKTASIGAVISRHPSSLPRPHVELWETRSGNSKSTTNYRLYDSPPGIFQPRSDGHGLRQLAPEEKRWNRLVTIVDSLEKIVRN